jgi:putative membrane protein
MNTAITLLLSFIALLHFYFLILEIFLWTKPLGLKVFRNSPQKAQDSAVLAANQGLYNGFLSAGLIWGILYSEALVAREIQIFFLSCVMLAGLYGAYSVSRRILFIQFLPAFIAFLLVYLNPNI